MTTHFFREYTTLEFNSTIDPASAKIGLAVVTVTGGSAVEEIDTPAAPDLVVEDGDYVQDNINYVAGSGGSAGTTTVKLRMNDAAPYEIFVYSSGIATLWDRKPDNAPTGSEFNAAISNTEDGLTILALFIEARDPRSNNEVVARRTQIVIIKHRQTA